MRPFCIVVLTCFVVFGRSNSREVAPQIVYGTYLGGRQKECATAIAVDGFGNAYVAGRTPWPDFPVTAGAFSTATNVNNDDRTGFVSKISEYGDQLLYSTFLGGSYRSSANAIASIRRDEPSLLGRPAQRSFPPRLRRFSRRRREATKWKYATVFSRGWMQADRG
jgi:Beta-propeller repeat